VASSLHSHERLLNRRPLVTFQQRVGKISQRLFENVLTSVKSLLLPQLPSFSFLFLLRMYPQQRVSSGPRTMLKNQQYRELAKTKFEQDRAKCWDNQNDSPHETLQSTAQSAYANASTFITKPSCLNVSSEKELEALAGNSNKEAVTYWSHELVNVGQPHFPITRLKRDSPLFARCASFTNDIQDSRVQHSEDPDSSTPMNN
jgi:hypothetical protein